MEKITERDLMVGDWMQHFSGNYFRVTRIDKWGDGSTHFACGHPHLWDYNNKFNPIPLTAEILEKNFPTIEDGVTWSETADSNLFNIRVEYDKYVEGIFKYIHELQHALQLCGIDKEIKL